MILNKNSDLDGVIDSKQLSPERRDELYWFIIDNARDYAIAAASARRIDRTGILPSTMFAMKLAASRLNVQPSFLLIDGNFIPQNLQAPAKSIVKGDSLSRSIAAASILAKVVRDRLMIKLDRLYPNYKFKDNKGYGTKYHMTVIESIGPCPHHRYSFAPVRQMKLNLK